jgi:hypothetical protein
MLPFPLQADVTGGGLLAVVVTFFVVAAFYAFTLHLAATFFIGDVPSQRAAYVSPAPTVVSLLLQRYGVESGVVSPGIGVAITLVATFVADAIAISYVYRLRWSSALPLTILHFTFAVVMGIALNGIFGFV